MTVCAFIFSVHQGVATENPQHKTDVLSMKKAIQECDYELIIKLIKKGVSPNTIGGVLNDQTAIGTLITTAALCLAKIQEYTEIIDVSEKEIQNLNIPFIMNDEMRKYSRATSCEALKYQFISHYFRYFMHYRTTILSLGQAIKDKKNYYEEYNKLRSEIDIALSKGAYISSFPFSDCAFEHDEYLPYAAQHFPKFININIQTQLGNTPLHKAVEHDNQLYNSQSGRKSRTEILLALGADPAIKNKNGQTPTHLAQLPVLQNLLTKESVRALQLPAYKKHDKEKNICISIRNRETGMQRKRIGK